MGIGGCRWLYVRVVDIAGVLDSAPLWLVFVPPDRDQGAHTWFGLPMLQTQANGKPLFPPLPERFFFDLGDPLLSLTLLPQTNSTGWKVPESCAQGNGLGVGVPGNRR